MQRQHLVIFFACLGSLFCHLSTKSFILCFCWVLINIRKSLIKKFIQGKDVSVTNVLPCYRHVYKKANHLSLSNHFALLLKLLMSTENKLKRKHGHSHREKVESLCQKCKRKWIGNFFLKELKKKILKTLNKSKT